MDAGNLDVQDVVSYAGNARIVATEWREGTELVRRDLWVSILTPQDLSAASGH
jgi:hypothetical protein